MGKGTIGINPFYHDGTIMSHGAMAGLLSVIISFTDAKSCKFLLLFLLPPSFLSSPFSLLISALWHLACFGLLTLAQMDWASVEIWTLG